MQDAVVAWGEENNPEKSSLQMKIDEINNNVSEGITLQSVLLSVYITPTEWQYICRREGFPTTHRHHVEVIFQSRKDKVKLVLFQIWTDLNLQGVFQF